MYYINKPSANFSLQSPIPSVPFSNAPPGVRPLVLGSQIGAGVGGLLGVERSLEEGMDEEGNLTNPWKALAKSAVYIPAGATVGTLTGLSGGVLANRVRGINNRKALNYANDFVFGEQ